MDTGVTLPEHIREIDLGGKHSFGYEFLQDGYVGAKDP
jgi:hypothetical protein